MLKNIILLQPKDTGGKSVFEALKSRKTERIFIDKELSPQLLSNILWAGFGVNREKGPFGVMGRTAATASNSQEIDLYVAMKDGVYHYNAIKNELEPVYTGDLRAMAINYGQKGIGSNAPIRIIFVADLEKYKTAGFQEPRLSDSEGQKSYYYSATGLIAGNIFVYASSQGLTAWFHNCEKEDLHKKLNLKPSQKVLFAQTVGWAK